MKQVTPGLHLKRRKNKNCHHSLTYPLFIILRSLVHIILRIIHCGYNIYLKNVFVRTYFSFYLILKNNTLALLSLKHTHKSRHQMMPTNFFPSRITNIHNQSLPQFQTSILIAQTHTTAYNISKLG